MKKLLLFMLLLATGVYGADVTEPVAIGYTTNDGGYLGIGRTRAGLNGDTLIFFPAKFGTLETAISLSDDAGDTWAIVTATPGASNYIDDHSGMWLADDGLHFAIRSLNNPVIYRYMASPFWDAGDYEAIDYLGASTFYSNVVADGQGNVWVVNNENTVYGLVISYHSTDRFASDTTVDTICHPFVSTTPLSGSMRINTILDPYGRPSVLVFVMAAQAPYTDGFREIKFDGTEWDSTDVYLSSALGQNDRAFDHTYFDSALHLVYADYDEDKLVHFWDSGGGNMDSCVISDYVVTDHFCSPVLSVYNDGDFGRLYCFFTVDRGDGDHMVAMKSWTPDGGWEDSTVCSAVGHDPQYSTAPRYIPSDYAFIPLSYRDETGNDTSYYVEVEAESAPVVVGSTRYIFSSDLPYTFNEDSALVYDTVRTTGNLTATAGAIVIQAGYYDTTQGVVFDFGTDTITWNTAAGSSVYGLQLNEDQNGGLLSDIEIIGGTFLQAAGGGASCNGLVIQGHDISLSGTEFVVNGNNCHALRCVGSLTSARVWNINLEYCNFGSGNRYYDSRCNYDGAAMIVSRFHSDAFAKAGYEYHFRMYGCTVDSTYGQGLCIYEPSYAAVNEIDCIIDSNYFYVDALNEQYPYDGGGGTTCHSAANSYGILTYGIYRGSKITRNTIESGTTYGGGRGIDLQFIKGTAAEPVEVWGNNIKVSEGQKAWGPEWSLASGPDTWGIRARYQSEGMLCSANVVVVFVGDPTTGYLNDRASAFYWTNYYGLTQPNRFVNDRLICSAATGWTTPDQAYALQIDGGSTQSSDDTLSVIQHNYLESPQGIVGLAAIEYIAGGTNSVLLKDDTLAFSATPMTGATTFTLGNGLNNWQTMNNLARDCIYLNGAAPDDISFSSDADAVKELTLQRTLSIYVNGSLNDLPVVGAYVEVLNDYDQTVLTGYSDSGGCVSGVVNYGYYAHPGDDSTDFNTFNVTASYGGYEDSLSEFEVGWDSAGGTATMNLAVEGTGEWGGSGEAPPIVYEDRWTGNIVIQGAVRIE